MDRSYRLLGLGISLLVAAAMALAIGAVVMGAVGPARPPASPDPARPGATPRPTPTPSPVATPKPTPRPSPSPSAPPADDARDGVDWVRLQNLHGVRSIAVVWDESGSLRDAVTGTPAPDPRVAPDEIEVVQMDDDTIRLIWSDLGIENEVRVTVRLTQDGIWSIDVVRPVQREPTDGEASERVLDLHFGVAVQQDTVDVEFFSDLLPSGSVGVARIDLDNAAGVDSRVVVWDETGSLAAARSGMPGTGASVRPGELRFDNLAEDGKVRLTWADLPIAGQARVGIRRADDGAYVVTLFRTFPQEPTDGNVLDRVLELDFHVSIPAGDVVVRVVDGLG